MTIRKVEIERFSVTSSKPFEAVVAALEAAVGHPDMLEYAAEGSWYRTRPLDGPRRDDLVLLRGSRP